jgi:NRPS condensation-like uncharacterized protein
MTTAEPDAGNCATGWPAEGARIADITRVDRWALALWADRPEMGLTVIVWLDRPLSEACLREAVRRLIARVPILCARPRLDARKPYWEFVTPRLGDLVARRELETDEAQRQQVIAAAERPPDATPPRGFRVDLVESPTAHTLLVYVHHFLMDGAGVFRAMEVLAECYRQAEAGAPVGPPLCMDRSWRQIVGQVPWWRFLLALADLFRRPFDAARMAAIRRRSAREVAGDGPGSARLDAAAHGWESCTIDAATVQAVRRGTDVPGATINDLALAAFAAAAHSWNAAHGLDREWTWLGYTVDLRRLWGQPAGMFANMSLFDFVPVRNRVAPHQVLRDLLPRLRRARRRMSRGWLRLAMLFSLIPPSRVSHLAQRMRQTSSFEAFSAAFLTNLGALPPGMGDYGRAQARTCCFSTLPLHPLRSVLMVSGYGGALRFDLFFERGYLSPAAAAAFLDLFRRQFESFAATRADSQFKEAAPG